MSVFSTRAVRSGTAALCAVLALLSSPSGAAAEDSPPGEPAKEGEPPGSVFRSGVGSGFRADTLEVNLSLGAGFGVRAIGGLERHDLALGSLKAGWIFTEVQMPDSYFAGNWEVQGEIFGGFQTSPRSGSVLGFASHLRYIIQTGTLFSPYFDGAMGVAETGIAEPDLSGRFQFNLQGGAGGLFFLSDALALDLQYRWFHLSNAGIEAPNHGLNTQMFYLGLSWFF